MVRLIFSSGILLLLAAINTDAKSCVPSSPGEIEPEVLAAITNLTTPTPIKCIAPLHQPDNGWDHWNDASFSFWGTGNTQNLPVVTAVVGLYRFPNAPWRTDKPNDYTMSYRDWWVWYLAYQIGEDPSTYPRTTFAPGFVNPPDHYNLKFFKGTELFSDIYDAPVVTSIVAVRYWAYLNGDSILIRLSQEYLRANWALYGMAAGYNPNSQAGPVWRYDLGPRLLPDGRTVPVRTPVFFPTRPNGSQFDPSAPRRQNGSTYFYNGHFLALAGARSKAGSHWNYDYKFPLFDRAIETIPSPLQTNELQSQKDILDLLEQKWADLQAGNVPPSAVAPPSDENLYGLKRQGDIPKIRSLITATDSSSVQTLISYLMVYLTKIRTVTVYRIMGWNGWRVSMMNTNPNGNNPNFYAVAYRADDPQDPDDTHALATFLFPWTDAQQAGADGWCKLEPPGADPAYARLHASNANTHGGQRPGQPVKEVVMSVPSSKPIFHLVLSSQNAPYLDNSSPTNWPPSDPPQGFSLLSGADQTFEGDLAWVSNEVPLGATTAADNDAWNWIDSSPAPFSDALMVHQSRNTVGMHQHYFYGATDELTVSRGDVLYALVYLDPQNPPSEVMLQWLEPGTGWEHRAFWGADTYNTMGQIGTASRRYMGPLPQPLGTWIRLEVPASLVGLENRTLSGMAFSLVDGTATWDEAGKNSPGTQLTNLAVGRATSQSSVYNGSPSQLAADGRTDGNYFNGSVMHTSLEAQAWWQIDLGASYSLNQINLWNRSDCCSERLSDFYVLVSENPFNSTSLGATLSQAGVSSYYVSNVTSSPAIVSVRRPGRFVRVQLANTNYLSVAEVEVVGQLVSPAIPTPTPPPSEDSIWVEDAIPAGATTISGGWDWRGSNPAPFSGSSHHQSALLAGGQQHFFSGATSTLPINTDDRLITYVYLDPVNPPTEIMLQWYDPSVPGREWEHRAYWGANQITSLGVDGTDSRRYMGVLPPLGQWRRLEIPASQVGLEGRTLTGMAFSQWDGRVSWDRSGKSTRSNPSPPPLDDTVWVEDGLPAGAVADSNSENWLWVNSSPTPASGNWAHQSTVASGIHQHFFTSAAATLTASQGEKLFAYVYLDPKYPPQEIMLQWFEPTSGWEHRAYWGADQIPWGTNGQFNHYYAGTLPAAGQWIRLEVPASSVGLESRTLTGMAFSLFNGRATWDRAGKRR